MTKKIKLAWAASILAAITVTIVQASSVHASGPPAATSTPEAVRERSPFLRATATISDTSAPMLSGDPPYFGREPADEERWGEATEPVTQYDIQIVAKEGDQLTTHLESEVSINDYGVVAFLGYFPEGGTGTEIAHIFAGRGSPNPLFDISPNISSTYYRTMGPSIQINNLNQIVLRRVLALPLGVIASTIDSYNASAPGSHVNLVYGELIAGEVDGLYPYPSINNTPGPVAGQGGIVFAALDHNLNYLATRTAHGSHIVQLSIELPNPLIADDDRFIMRRGTDNITVLPPTFFPFVDIATISSGRFSALGKRPGIADDGWHVAFWGNLTVLGATAYGTYPGPGVFAATSDASALIRVVGAADGFADAGYEDHGRVSITSTADSVLTVAFVGTNSEGQRGLYTRNLTHVHSLQLSGEPSPVIVVGDLLADGSTVTDLRAPYDGAALIRDGVASPVPGDHRTALWVNTNSGERVLRATGRAYSPPDVVDFNSEALNDVSVPLRQRLIAPASAVRGLAADGITTVLLRTKPLAEPGRVRFTLRDNHDSVAPADVGTLSDPFRADIVGNPLEIELSGIAGEAPYCGFALLRAPVDFVRGSEDEPLGSMNPRRLYLTTEFIPDVSPPSPPLRSEIELHRPPVVLLHGLGGSDDDFQWALRSDPRFVVETSDYESTHASFFLTNLFVLGNSVERAVERMRHQNLAVTQADVFGHSMGGLLSRLYMLDSFDDLHGHHYETDFLRDVWGIRGLRSNFGAGDVHKFVSVNSPHYGSQVSDLLVTETNDLTPIGFIAQMWADYDLQTGAPFDLRTDSDIISVINSTVAPRAIPSHAICGQYWLPPGPPTRPYDARTYMLGKACGYPVDFIFGGPNDLVVSTDSQLGGFGSSTSSTITGIEGRHYPTVHDYPLGMTNARAVTLLNAPASSSLFAPGFPLTAGPYPAAPSCLAAIDVLPEPSLEISLGSVKGSHVPKSVAPVDTVLAGALLQIDVSVLDGFSPAELFIFVGNDTLAVVDHAPCSVQLPAPNDLVGIVTVRAVAVDGDNRWAHADSVTVAVAPAGPLVSIRTQSPQITLTGTSCRSTIEVYGIYSDGIERYIDPGFIPVAFNILAPGVVSVSNLGRIEAIGAGSAFVQVAVGTVSTLVAVTSTGTCQYPSAIDDGDEPQWDGIPRPFALMQNAPNPFNPNTEICFNLERNGHATLEIFDVRGRRICVLHDGPLGMGRHTVRWNGQDGAGRPAASGMYFYRLRAGDQIAVRKMLMLR